MNVFESNRRALMREVRIMGLIPSLAADLRSDGVAFPWSTANQIAEAMVDAEPDE